MKNNERCMYVYCKVLYFIMSENEFYIDFQDTLYFLNLVFALLF